MISDAEYLERIVAGIHAVTTTEAEVTWNEIIDGRQFDVVVRFKLGTLRYLVLIEVKNRTRKASAPELEAFVTKTQDHKANKAVFVTAAGFQSGAITVAKRHGIGLFTLTFDNDNLHLSDKSSRLVLSKKGAEDIPPIIEIGEPELVANIESVTLNYATGKKKDMPKEPSQMTYYTGKTTLEDGRTIDLVLQQAPIADVVLGQSRREEIRINPQQRIYPPDNYFFPSGVLASMECTVTGRMGNPLRGNTLIDPGSFSYPVIYTNVITGEEIHMTMDQLPLGGSTVEVGAFYFQPHPLNYYYCEDIREDTVYWKLIESFQSGKLFTGSMSQDIKYSPYFIPVTDKKTIKRLQKRLRDFRARSRKTKRR